MGDAARVVSVRGVLAVVLLA
jgi:hypothetical protein